MRRGTTEILSGLPPILQRYEAVFGNSQGKWYQEECVETIGIQLAMLTALQPASQSSFVATTSPRKSLSEHCA